MKIHRCFTLGVLILIPRLSQADDQSKVQSNGVVIVSIGNENAVDEMAVYPQGGIANRPLLVMAHGNGSSGPKEIQGWIALSKQHDFTIVCPTFLSSVHSMHVPEDVPYFKDCLRWIEDNLQYDKQNVFMSGISGGGYAVWYLGTTRPDFFRGLFLQSANFAGQDYGLDISKWHEKPIKLIWGSQDLPDIPVQNQKAIDLITSEHCTNFTTEVIPGGHHEEHPEMVIGWMEKQTGASSN
jgi:poly(3-hydroxybutyrate) depolymerase